MPIAIIENDTNAFDNLKRLEKTGLLAGDHQVDWAISRRITSTPKHSDEEIYNEIGNLIDGYSQDLILMVDLHLGMIDPDNFHKELRSALAMPEGVTFGSEIEGFALAYRAVKNQKIRNLIVLIASMANSVQKSKELIEEYLRPQADGLHDAVIFGTCGSLADTYENARDSINKAINLWNEQLTPFSADGCKLFRDLSVQLKNRFNQEKGVLHNNLRGFTTEKHLSILEKWLEDVVDHRSRLESLPIRDQDRTFLDIAPFLFRPWSPDHIGKRPAGFYLSAAFARTLANGDLPLGWLQHVIGLADDESVGNLFVRLTDVPHPSNPVEVILAFNALKSEELIGLPKLSWERSTLILAYALKGNDAQGGATGLKNLDERLRKLIEGESIEGRHGNTTQAFRRLVSTGWEIQRGTITEPVNSKALYPITIKIPCLNYTARGVV